MSDENKGGGAQGQPDDLKNLKAEFQRKHENALAEQAAIKQQLQALLQTQQKPEPKTEEIDPYDPDKYIAAIETRVEKKLQAEREAENRARQLEQRRQQAIVGLIQDYPELQDPTSDLVKETQAILSQLPPEEQSTSVAYKAAILEAAKNKGVQPRSKRSSGDDSFQMGGSRGESGSKKSKEEFRPKVEAWMELLKEHTNVDFNKPEVRARVKARQDRRFGGGNK
jgi:hypothetical protein